MPLTWKEAISNRKYVLLMFFWLVGLAVFVAVLPHFFNNVLLNKPGPRLDDFAFRFLAPKDWSPVIFALVFGAPALFLFANFSSPEKILVIFQCYVVVNFLRIVSLYLFTLETPEGIIPLVDHFLEKVAYGGNAAFTKDLFFSGHTSTLFIISLAEKRRGLRIVLILSTILIGVLLVWQRVHYSIDVIGALVVTYVVYKGITALNRVTFRRD
jgi:hypothetical protein